MNEQTFAPPSLSPNKEGPFLPGMNARGILARIGDIHLATCVHEVIASGWMLWASCISFPTGIGIPRECNNLWTLVQ